MSARAVRRWVAAAVVAAFVCAGASPVLATPSSAGAERGAEAIVSFDPAKQSEALASVRAEGGRVLRLLRSGHDALVVFPERATMRAIGERLTRSGAVRRVAPNGMLRPAWVPNDPLYPQQWALASIRVPAAWNLTRGSASVAVAVIDSGVDLSHPDLAANLDTAHDWDFVNNDAVADEEYPHGTHVAGIVAAVADNATGVAGVAPSTKVLPLKVIGRSGVASTADFVDALRYAADVGARVVNASLGEALDPAVPDDAAEIAVLQEAVDYARAKGALVVAASGNGSGPPVWYPAACDGVVAVSATARDGSLAPYSSTGPQVDLAAPGGWAVDQARLPAEGILSTWNGGGYAYAQGTSMASPHVAGVAALLLALKPSTSPAELEAALEASAKDVGAPGVDAQSGYGLVQADAAVNRLGRVFRIGGADRYATAVAASKAVFGSGECATVVIASGERFPDALAASPLAGALHAPVLLVRRDAVPDVTLAEIERLGVTRVVVVGGPAAVASGTVAALEGAGLAVERIGGADRYETAALVARRVLASSAETITVLVARGDEFPDGVAASGPAASSGSPLVLVRTAALPGPAKDAIAAAAPCSVVVLGGEAAVSEAVRREIAAIPGVIGVTRWGGVDRYATAAAIATGAVESGLCGTDLVAVASGVDFPDALSGGTAAGARRGAVVLSRPLSLSEDARGFVSRSLGPASAGWVLGGASALSWTVQADLIRAMP
ncbi:S8 family serine peptidase [Coriobacteriia bacterium Es71-Z0120]|uniref:S8 family serine peptidase n=1 Tax=Parvivirga hydrogeniphila TaxID=2939460 RepID=UPI002260CF19|nr:S8 family serine peptidase [Parvivirga hydrogeniphila]MCL4078206.1 S8 family serine peptidase [Parvivirga hydrogeniphila]